MVCCGLRRCSLLSSLSLTCTDRDFLWNHALGLYFNTLQVLILDAVQIDLSVLSQFRCLQTLDLSIDVEEATVLAVSLVIASYSLTVELIRLVSRQSFCMPSHTFSP